MQLFGRIDRVAAEVDRVHDRVFLHDVFDVDAVCLVGHLVVGRLEKAQFEDGFGVLAQFFLVYRLADLGGDDSQNIVGNDLRVAFHADAEYLGPCQVSGRHFRRRPLRRQNVRGKGRLVGGNGRDVLAGRLRRSSGGENRLSEDQNYRRCSGDCKFSKTEGHYLPLLLLAGVYSRIYREGRTQTSYLITLIAGSPPRRAFSPTCMRASISSWVRDASVLPSGFAVMAALTPGV